MTIAQSARLLSRMPGPAEMAAASVGAESFIGMRSDDDTYRTAAIEAGRGDGARIPSPQTSEKGVTSRERPALSFKLICYRVDARHLVRDVFRGEYVPDEHRILELIDKKREMRARIAARGGVKS